MYRHTSFYCTSLYGTRRCYKWNAIPSTSKKIMIHFMARLTLLLWAGPQSTVSPRYACSFLFSINHNLSVSNNRKCIQFFPLNNQMFFFKKHKQAPLKMEFLGTLWLLKKQTNHYLPLMCRFSLNGIIKLKSTCSMLSKVNTSLWNENLLQSIQFHLLPKTERTTHHPMIVHMLKIPTLSVEV